MKRKQNAASSHKKQLERSLLVDGVLLSEERRDIVELPVKDLLNKLQDGTLSCVDVMKAYQAKALEVTKELNCVTEFIKEAQVIIQYANEMTKCSTHPNFFCSFILKDWALELDQSTIKGPLHGLPISIKDNIGVAGYDATTGVSIRIDLPAREDAPLVTALKKLGAVPFCLTNIPQTMMRYQQK